jgi:hypothetical protein
LTASGAEEIFCALARGGENRLLAIARHDMRMKTLFIIMIHPKRISQNPKASRKAAETQRTRKDYVRGFSLRKLCDST